MSEEYKDDWGIQSLVFDQIKQDVLGKSIETESEAQTRFDVIDRLLKEVFGWKYGQITVEDRQEQEVRGYVDYLLRSGDIKIVVEAKKLGASFPSPTKVKKARLNGSLLSNGEIASAIRQAIDYSKSKIAQITVVTNGACWCFFKTEEAVSDKNAEVRLLFPFENPTDAEELFHLFSNENLAANGLRFFNDGDLPSLSNRILSIVRDSEMRVERNKVADFITPALDSVLHSESFINNPSFLRDCFVYTTARSRFDSTLHIHLMDNKPVAILPAKRVKSGPGGQLETLVSYGRPTSAPPVILLLAEVGVGKSTYLKHFQLVEGKTLLEQKKVHWVYIDFEGMGLAGNVREFLYRKLKEYLLDTSKSIKTDFQEVLRPAYENEIEGLRNGPYALVAGNKAQFDKIVTDYIARDFEAVEPFVNKVFKYLSQKHLCVLVLDNTDLFEDENLEKLVLSEGLALSKNLLCNIIVSIRDTTYVKHKNNSIFNAHELKKIWLDPPPFKEVLSKRLSFSALVLRKRYARIPFSKGMTLTVPDLSKFFEIAQRSLLSGVAADFIESFGGQNIRRGLTLVVNFLNSGHIQADRALHAYLNSNTEYTFPFHEVFKGSILGQWKYYKESRSQECINIFDSRLNSKRLRLLRLHVLGYLYMGAQSEETTVISVAKCIEVFSKLGASTRQIIFVIKDLVKYQLIKELNSVEINKDSQVFITKSGAYYFVHLGTRLSYVEACLHDTAVDEMTVWHELSALTQSIESEQNIERRMNLRRTRAKVFSEYLKSLEEENCELLGTDSYQPFIARMYAALDREFTSAVSSIRKHNMQIITD